MATGNAEDIFETFRRFRASSRMETSEAQFDRYCKEVLSSVEKLHFDYKTKHDSRSSNLDESDKKNLAKAISGFANTGGGVLLWGVNEGPPPILKAITGVEAFLKRLLDLAGQATDPRVQGIDGEWLPSKEDPTAGYVALLIPESQLPPHRVILKLENVQHHYYFRTASNFDIASHFQLEDMFGRRPQPKLVARRSGKFSIVPPHARPHPRTAESYKWKIPFDIVNEGRGTAKLVYVEFLYQVGMSVGSSNLGWNGSYSTVNQESNSATITFALTPDRVLHPGMMLRFDALELKDSIPPRPTRQTVQFPCRIYCEGAAPVLVTIKGELQEWQGQER